ncbi:TetR/AcrR family transcriptional regulator [Mycolicibacterium fluoranthenivorans]|uniref:AcrR family transcriptional regulator n=1 Tax=Mycolicibacterium fluoranthenivorans TaxID=258505 RepID=A0A7X5TW21_9MYCO|nr:TetR/AcrR family transcriptional regulator C-terminal domain-containing protein [Mycolicibacterium fluoranthenivorans]MCV7355096.1 TetR/AcrR family transcriptional regulator C-terminal domain-containing protein [Mycolicibacterium fluoranthenivorans]NIH93786.1 AcrR family transcriptional regulator [Mycolicibacterium fluoranthenivorans]
MTAQVDSDDRAPRRRGRPRRISHEQIVEAARGIAPAELTMQAVADALGVDRTALHYYVGDRDGLLELVVADLFDTELRTVELPAHADWREVLRAYASAVRDGVLRCGVTATNFRLRGIGGTAGLALAERVLVVLTGAGFAVDDAGRILTLVAGIAMSAAHDVLGSAESRLHHQTPEVARALNELPAQDFPLLSAVVADRPGADDFDFNLGVVIAGLERHLKL